MSKAARTAAEHASSSQTRPSAPASDSSSASNVEPTADTRPTPSTPGTELPDGVGIVHLVAEYWPYARSGGLAEAVRGIALHQAASGTPTTVVMPLYGSVREAGYALKPFGAPFEVPLGGTTETAQLWEASESTSTDPSSSEPAAPSLTSPGRRNSARVLMVDHEHFFERDGLYGTGGRDFDDNHRRFAFLARAVLEALPTLGSDRYVIHAHDWHTALASVYLRTLDWSSDVYARSVCVLSVHNAGYQGNFPPSTLRELGLSDELYRWDRMEWYGGLNWLKGGLVHADYVTTVSPTHAHELRTPLGGFGLHDQFIALGDRLVGIRNGIDQTIWDPEHDPDIPVNYGRDDLSGKAACKADLQAAADLPVEPEVPLIAMTARLVKQKGFDIILDDGLLYRLPAQFIFLGEGEARYAAGLAEVAARIPERVAVFFEFTELREHRLLAGADFLMMPSLYEPCGLTQMRAQRYGALPIVRRVGGLADTVEDQVTGFVFDEYTPAGLERAVRRAIDAYRSETWPEHQSEAMNRDFGWMDSARRYHDLYRRALGRVERWVKAAPA